MTAHTPGPWAVSRGVTGSLLIHGSPGVIATMAGAGTQDHTDARLIAAAPELLEALLALDAFLSDPSVGPTTPDTARRLGNMARAAIAKASGGAS